ncbi:hypothetical protein YPPY09_3598, partial [Yersinia pestis PY-09]
MILIICFDHEY